MALLKLTHQLLHLRSLSSIALQIVRHRKIAELAGGLLRRLLRPTFYTKGARRFVMRMEATRPFFEQPSACSISALPAAPLGGIGQHE